MFTSGKPIADICPTICCRCSGLSREPEAPDRPLRPDAELTPLVVERVEIVLAALEPTSPVPPIFAKGSRELRISARAF